MKHSIFIVASLLALSSHSVIAQNDGDIDLIDVGNATITEIFDHEANVTIQEIELTADVDESFNETDPVALSDLETAISDEIFEVAANETEVNATNGQNSTFALTGVELVSVEVVEEDNDDSRVRRKLRRRKRVKISVRVGGCHGCSGSSSGNWISGRRKLNIDGTDGGYLPSDAILLQALKKVTTKDSLVKDINDLATQDLSLDVIADLALANADIRKTFTNSLKTHVENKRAEANGVLADLKAKRSEMKTLRKERSNILLQKQKLRNDNKDDKSSIAKELADLKSQIDEIDSDIADISTAIAKQLAVIQHMRKLASKLSDALKVDRQEYRDAKKEARAAMKDAKGSSVADSVSLQSAIIAAVQANNDFADHM